MKNPTMNNADKNISQICNPKESDYEKAMRVSQEMSQFIGDLK